MIRQQLFSLHSFQVLMLSLLLGTSAMVLLGVRDSLGIAERSIQDNLKVVVLIQTQLSDDLARKWAEGLPTQDSEIESVTFISKAEALQKAQEDPALVKSLILLRDNPLPASAVIRFKPSAWMERPEPALQLRASPEVQEIRWDPEKRSTFQTLHQWRTWLLRISTFAVILLSVWAIVSISSAVVSRIPMPVWLTHSGMALFGAALSLLVVGLSLQKVGVQALEFKPDLNTPWPWISSFLGSFAMLGSTVKYEK